MRCERAALDEVVQQFVDEQRRAARAGGDRLVDPRRDVASQPLGDHGVDGRPVQATDLKCRRPRGSPQGGEQLAHLRTAVGFVRAGGQHQEQRAVRQVETQVLQHLEAGLIGPMDVVEREHDGLLGPDAGDERGEGILGAHLERLGRGDRRLQFEPLDQRAQRGETVGQAGDLLGRSRSQVPADGRDERLVGHRRRQLPGSAVEHPEAAAPGLVEQRRHERALAAATLALDQDDGSRAVTRLRQRPREVLAFMISPRRRTGHSCSSGPTYVEYVQGTDARAPGRLADWLHDPDHTPVADVAPQPAGCTVRPVPPPA